MKDTILKVSDAQQYAPVTARTIYNWIDAAMLGDNDLEILQHDGKKSLANTVNNIEELERLYKKRSAYHPRNQITIHPTDDFYKVFSATDIFNIIKNIETYSEIPRQYNYYSTGSKYWSTYTSELIEKNSTNIMSSTIDLLRQQEHYIADILKKYDDVNIIDIGVGNAEPIKPFLTFLYNTKKLKNYIGLDISKSMLSIAEKNILDWFPKKLKTRFLQYDVAKEQFIGVTEEYSQTKRKVINCVLLLGGTLANMRDMDFCYRNIHYSMTSSDLLIHVTRLDSQHSRQQFSFYNSQINKGLPDIHRYVLDLLNISPDLYTVTTGFDSHKNERFEKILFKKRIELVIKTKSGNKKIQFNEKQSLQTWRGRHLAQQDTFNLLKNNGFNLQLACTSSDGQYLLTISKIDS